MPVNPNDQPDNTAIVLQVLASLRGDIGHIRDGMAEVKAEQVAQGVKLEQVLRQATLTNGRVTDLEKRHLSDDGYAAGRKAERDRLYFVAKVASKPATWAWGVAAAAVAYVAKDRAG